MTNRQAKHADIHGVDDLQGGRDKYSKYDKRHIAILEDRTEIFIHIVIPKCDKETSNYDKKRQNYRTKSGKGLAIIKRVFADRQSMREIGFVFIKTLAKTFPNTNDRINYNVGESCDCKTTQDAENEIAHGGIRIVAGDTRQDGENGCNGKNNYHVAIHPKKIVFN